MNELINFMVNNGIGVVCIAYFMYRDYRFMAKLTDLLGSLKATLDVLRKVESVNRRAEDTGE